MQRQEWLIPTKKGLYCEPGDFFIDPTRVVPRAVITHGHADHARRGHQAVLATAETLGVMRARLGPKAVRESQALALGEPLRISAVDVRLAPAGHVFGSAQVVMDYRGERAVVTGDYKRRPDPTCPSFEPVTCDLFVTEATFGLPVYRHPPADDEIRRLLESVALFVDRPHLVGAYSFGKAQRLLALLRAAGYDAPIWLHPTLWQVTNLYRATGLDFGDLRRLDESDPGPTACVVLAPPSAGDRLLAPLMRRRPVRVSASGWMGVRRHWRRGGAGLPLAISDHADWLELTETIKEVSRERFWVMHGDAAALVHFGRTAGLDGQALPAAIALS